ncbi:hypothetical protein MKK69_01635 [Methylobacterium sp. J-026]|uniref:hypothetical protein n=1 Tax=Methylobacterium sp. J-026 TaxID=2836624 RepID=UPI001FB8C3B9|nr:hypothetical protein [Methylobacterium sp. J-026]MCJ2132777.1 hypothetical protein [Methylobacterium sp. J-026]
MPTRQILVRVALALVLMGAFMMLADGMAQREPRQATGTTIAVAAHPAGGHEDE